MNTCLNCAYWIDPLHLGSKDLWWRNDKIDGKFYGRCAGHRVKMGNTLINTSATATCEMHQHLNNIRFSNV